MERTDIKRTTLCVTTFCNLKCKHCLAFIPYYKDPSHLSFEEAKIILKRYFEVVDSVEHFNITGGEPLLNQELERILEEVYYYSEQIRGTVDFVTNGTMEIPETVLEIFAKKRDKTKVVLSDYGKNLSKKIDVIESELIRREIPYRISKFYGDELYYGGWIDFSNHDLKWETQEDRDLNAQKCIQRIGKYFVINNGELHGCSRSFWRIKQGIIPKIEGEYVPLIDEGISLEKKRELLMHMYYSKSSESCAHCVGLCNGVQRVKPALQLR